MKPLKLFILLISSVFLITTNTVFAAKITLRIGTDPTFFPFEYTDKVANSALVGFDIDLMEAIANASDFNIRWEVKPFDILEQNLKVGYIDAIISGVTVNNDRLEAFDFSQPYLTSGRSLMIRKKDRTSIIKQKDLEGRDICFLDKNTPKTEEIDARLNFVHCKALNECVENLSKGRCDGFVYGFASLNNYLVKNPNPDLMVVNDIFKLDLPLAVMVRKDLLRTKIIIDDGLEKIKTDGTYKNIYDKWFSWQ